MDVLAQLSFDHALLAASLLDRAVDLIREHAALAYLIIIVWTFLEGETIVIVCGYLAAQEGGPSIVLVILSALIGGMAGDQTWFFVGRLKGKAFIARRPMLQRQADKVHRMLEKWHTLLILGFRFLYGLRNATPFVLGMGEVKTSRFVVLNAIGAVIWAISFGLAGYFLGEAVETTIKNYQIEFLAGLVGLILGVWVIRVLLRVRRSRRAAQALQSGEGQP